MNKILIAFGTRPELIKLAPVINEFRIRNQRDRLFIINTNQHREFIHHELEHFQIEVDYEFTLDRKVDSLALLNGLLLLEFNKLASKLKVLKIIVDAIIAQGDTCSTFSTAQFAFYEKIPFYHVEAGLRTNDFNQPFPEEYFRKSISTIAAMHFTPTRFAKSNLISEGIHENLILITGNTAIDNLKQFKNIEEFRVHNDTDNKLVIITIHRRENIKNNLEFIIDRIIEYVKKNPNKKFVWIDNPGYKIEPEIKIQLSNLKVIQPVPFAEMIELYKKTQLIITDSGGIQEETAYLGIPTLLFRIKSERIEAINSGISKYFEDSDTDLETVIKSLSKNRLPGFNPIYGDGNASKKIVDYIVENIIETDLLIDKKYST